MAVPLTLSSVPAQTPYVQYVSGASQTVFPYPFEITQDSDLVCLINGVARPTDAGYTLTGQGATGGGNLTFTVGQTLGAIITLYRNITIARITQLSQNGTFFSANFNDEFNRIYLIMQQLQQSLLPGGNQAFALMVPNSNSPAPITLLTPAVYASKYLAFDANGNPTPALLTSSGSLTAAIIYSLTGITGPATPQELAASVTVVNQQYGQGHVRRYGAVGDGVTVDFAAFQAAFAVVVTAGQGDVVCEPGDTYNLGNVTADGKTTPLLAVIGLTNCTVHGKGATIKTNTTASVFGAVFGIVNPNNVCFYDLNFYDSGFDQSQNGLPNFKCAHSIFASNTGSADYSGITLVNCQASHTGSLFSVWRNGTGRIRNINLFGCRELNCFYGPSFQQQGDNVTVSGHYVLNPVRAYFPIDVTGHNVDIHVHNDGTNANATADGLCDIKRSDFDIKNIKLRLTVTGQAYKYGALVNFIHVTTSNAPALMDDIDVELQLANATFSGTGAGIPVQFTDQTGGSIVNPTANRWDHIKIHGDFGAWTATSLQNPINITSQPTSAGGIGNVSVEGLSNIQMSTPQAYPGFVVKTAPNKFVYTKTGNLTTGNIPIDLTKYTGTLFCLRVTVYAEGDYTLGLTTQSYRQYVLFGYNSAGTVTISSTNVAQTYDSGAGSVVSFAASGNFINITFTNFTSANAQARVEVEHLSKFL